jgi:hypothetical protein
MPDSTNEDGPGLPEKRPARSQLYPWYDSVWLTEYDRAKAIIRTVRPDALEAFVDAFRMFHTRPDFEVQRLERPFDNDTLAEIRARVTSLRPTDLELHEARRFGRFIVHDHWFFTELQRRAIPLVSEVVGEPVEPSYNFLSLYTAMGVCPVHMDAPKAKWTFDLCIDQSVPWPIYFSQVCPWPDSESEAWRDEDWEGSLKRSTSLRFTPYTLQPGQAVVFSGSSQWHYRDAMPDVGGQQFCNLLFLHFIPSGTTELVQPKNWARLFGIPELLALANCPQ